MANRFQDPLQPLSEPRFMALGQGLWKRTSEGASTFRFYRGGR